MKKICTKCGEGKELEEFGKKACCKDGLQCWCKECISIYGKKYCKNNKEKIAKRRNSYYNNHKETEKEHVKVWRTNNPITFSASRSRWMVKRKRNLGFNPLNKKFPGSVGHHINMNDVIYIPEEIHRSMPHSQNDPISMEEINMKAKEYLQEELYAL